jgi:hypothetical protein
MFSYIFAIVFWAFFTLEGTHASPLIDHSAVQGTFRYPGSRIRPRFRYWLPDASVDGQVVAADIKSAGSIGAGGVEFVPFFNYGGDHGAQPKGANWSTFAFGSPAYRELLVDALRAHKESGLYMDMAIGPNQGQGVPASPDDEGLQWDLVSWNPSIQSESRVDVSDSIHYLRILKRIVQSNHPRLGRGKR